MELNSFAHLLILQIFPCGVHIHTYNCIVRCALYRVHYSGRVLLLYFTLFHSVQLTFILWMKLNVKVVVLLYIKLVYVSKHSVKIPRFGVLQYCSYANINMARPLARWCSDYPRLHLLTDTVRVLHRVKINSIVTTHLKNTIHTLDSNVHAHWCIRSCKIVVIANLKKQY